MTEDDGHEDKLIGRIIDEAIKNIFAQHLDVREFRPIVDYFESGQQRRAGRHAPDRSVLERIAKVPGLRKRAEELAAKAIPDLSERDAREAATASAAEFILEGLHVHNKLNKAAKAGATGVAPAVIDGRSASLLPSLNRGTRRDPLRGYQRADHVVYLNTPSGTARSSSSRSRPTRPSTSSPST